MDGNSIIGYVRDVDAGEDARKDAASEMETLRQEVQHCDRCPLHETRTCVVFGDGRPDAPVMIVGEAPGRSEDETGRTFVGKAGERLTEMLGHAGLTRDDVYIANVLKCRPPKNRNPKTEEVDACAEFLVRQIVNVSPKVVVTFGNFATQFVLDTKEGVSELHGKPVDGVVLMDWDDDETQPMTVFPVFHPAATIYRPQWRSVLEEDMRTLGRLLAERGVLTGATGEDGDGDSLA